MEQFMQTDQWIATRISIYCFPFGGILGQTFFYLPPKLAMGPFSGEAMNLSDLM